MRSLLALAILASLAFAGCSGGGGDEESPGGTQTQSGTSGPSRSATSSGSVSSTSSQTGQAGGGEANRPPVAQISAQVVGLRANLTLAGTDPDGDALSWSLDFGDGSPAANGTALPANATHDFAAAGLYNVTLNVTDGEASHEATVTVNATAAGRPPFVITATYQGIDPGAVLPVGNPARQPSCITSEDGIGGNWHTYSEDLTGWTFTVTPAKFVAIFYKADGSTRTGTFGSSGVVPADSAEVDICTSDPQAGGRYTFTATAP